MIFLILMNFQTENHLPYLPWLLQGTEDVLMAKLHETVAALELAAAAVLESKRPKVEIKEEVEGAWAEGVKGVFKWKGFFVVVVVVAAWGRGKDLVEICWERCILYFILVGDVCREFGQHYCVILLRELWGSFLLIAHFIATSVVSPKMYCPFTDILWHIHYTHSFHIYIYIYVCKIHGSFGISFWICDPLIRFALVNISRRSQPRAWLQRSHGRRDRRRQKCLVSNLTVKRLVLQSFRSTQASPTCPRL